MPRMLILVTDEETLGRFARIAEDMPWARGRGLAFDVLRGDVQQSIAEWRDREHDAPLGFSAPDEPSVLAALSGGADDAVVFERIDASSLTAFADRLELRARLRAETQRTHARLAHAEKLTALGTLVAGVGHEINNPLSAVMLSIEAAKRQVLPVLDAASDIARADETNSDRNVELLQRLRSSLSSDRGGRNGATLLDDLSSAANAIASIVRDLRVFARTDDHELPEPVDICELVDHVLRLLGHDLSKHGVVERDYPADLPQLILPRNRVTQVIMNVLINATHAIAEIERPLHRVRIHVRSDEDFVAVGISDTGPGIPAESLERIFDPFYTTKRQDMGTGLGLSISRSIMRKLGGDVTVESVYGEGASFICFLPLPSREMMRDAWQRRMAGSFIVPQSRSTTVMVVDDDPRMLRSYARLLNADHRIMVAHDGRDAIDMLESGSEATLAVVELDLPGNDGPQLLSWLAQNRPELAGHTLIVTSPDAENRYADFLRLHHGPVLHKPVRGEHLLSAIATMLKEEPAH